MCDPIKLISALRSTDMYIKIIFEEGSCYRFHLFLKRLYPEALCYINEKGNHVVTKIGNRLYDINGTIPKSCEKHFTLLTYTELEKVKKWSFAKNRLLQLKECPYCEESICA